MRVIVARYLTCPSNGKMTAWCLLLRDKLTIGFINRIFLHEKYSTALKAIKLIDIYVDECWEKREVVSRRMGEGVFRCTVEVGRMGGLVA